MIPTATQCIYDYLKSEGLPAELIFFPEWYGDPNDKDEHIVLKLSNSYYSLFGSIPKGESKMIMSMCCEVLNLNHPPERSEWGG